jgi:PAS domain S-box-containing protein
VHCFENATVGLALSTPQGLIARVNGTCARMLGYTPDDLRGVHFSTVAFPDDVERTREVLTSLLTGEHTTRRYEKRYLHRDGYGVWADVSVFLLRDDAGAPLCFISSIQETTERRRAEETLRSSEYFFRESQRAAHIGSYKLDFASGVWESSEVLDTIFGIDPDYVRNVLGWLSLVHPSDRDAMDRYLADEVIARHQPFDREYRIIRRSDRQTRWVHGRGELSLSAQGGLRFLIGTIQDVTDRKQAEQDLLAREARHRAVLQTAMDGFCRCGPEGHLLEVNDAYCRMSGYSAEELLTMRISDMEARETPEEVASHLAQIVRDGHDRFESKHRRKDGSTFDVEISVKRTARDGDGHTATFVRDITERKRAEEERATLEAQLRQAQKMESVGRLAGGVAHDFNNMLAAILGHTELALEEVPRSSSVYASLVEIRQAAERSAALTRQLLAFARKQTVVPRVLSLNETVEGMLRMIDRLLGEDIDLVWHPQTNLWPIRLDPSQLDQILVNLCVNARDAITGHGAITLETQNVTVEVAVVTAFGSLPPGEYVRLTVADNGCGMDRETLSHLFEPFFTTKGVGKGTGLGLATVYGAVRQSGGLVDVASEPGKGTSFAVYLPRDNSRAEPARSPGASIPVLQGTETILLVEDEPSVRSLTARMLSRLGYAVLVAATPNEALGLAARHVGQVALVMTDVIMPGMNGLELANRLLSRDPNLKRLFMSGHTADVIAPFGVLDERTSFIAKPFSSRTLAIKLREVLEG